MHQTEAIPVQHKPNETFMQVCKPAFTEAFSSGKRISGTAFASRIQKEVRKLKLKT